MKETELVLATRNRNKVKEIKQILKGLGLKILSLSDFPRLPEVKEGGKSFEENAIRKARKVSAFTKRIALADDSGLEIEALQGAPGVISSRFAGKSATDEENIQKVLRLLGALPSQKRKAIFRCVIAICLPTGEVKTVEGSCTGYITFKPRGRKGFGYDPIFWVSRYKRTFAGLNPKIKNRISHRAKALKKARKILKEMI